MSTNGRESLDMAERFIAKEALVELGTQIFITAGEAKKNRVESQKT